MILFGVNIVLGLGVTMLAGLPGVLGFAAGFAVCFAALWAGFAALGQPMLYFRRALRIAHLIVFFLYELVVSSVAVVWDVVTPQHLSRPAIIDMPLDVRSDAEILLVTNLISLTPGTLSLDVSEDRRVLRVHAMFAEDPEALVAQLKNGMERRVRAVFET